MKKVFAMLLLFSLVAATNVDAQSKKPAKDTTGMAAKRAARAAKKAEKEKQKAAVADNGNNQVAKASTKPAKDTTGQAAKRAARAAKKAAKAQAAQQATTVPVTTTTPPPPAPARKPAVAPPAPKTVTQGTNTSGDKAVGTDAKGRTIYEGPRGGHYVITATGHKEYIRNK